MIDNCRLKDRELAEMLREEYKMDDQALHPTTVLKYGHNKMPEMGLGNGRSKWYQREILLLTRRRTRIEESRW